MRTALSTIADLISNISIHRESNEQREAANSRFSAGLTGNETVTEKTDALPHHSYQGDASLRYESGLTHNVNDTYEVPSPGFGTPNKEVVEDEQHNSINKTHHSSSTSLSKPPQGSPQYIICQDMKDNTLEILDVNNKEQKSALPDLLHRLLERGEIAVLGAFTSAPNAPSDLTDLRMAVMRGDFAPELLKIAESAQAVCVRLPYKHVSSVRGAAQLCQS